VIHHHVHHGRWLDLMLDDVLKSNRREAVRFIAACSQENAGAFLNAAPSPRPFRIPSWAFTLLVQRRLGLSLSL